MITCVIPVKGNSERLPAKNLRIFNGEPLFIHKFRQLEKVPFDKIVVSSECEEVLFHAEQFGFISHQRDPKYSTPDIPMSEVYKYVSSEVEGDDIAWVNVTNPLVDTDIYECALDDWKNNSQKKMLLPCDCLLSVYNLQKYVFWKGEPVNWVPSEHPRSQDLGGLMALNFAINIRPKKDVIREGCFIGKDPYFFILDEITSTKIDYQWQFDLCESIWKKR